MFIITLKGARMNKDLVISVKTILLTLGLIFGFFVMYRLRGILALLFIALLLVISLEPAIKSLSKVTFLNKPLSRGVAVFIAYATLVLVLILAFVTAVPIIVRQSQSFVDNFSYFLSGIYIGDKSLAELFGFLDVLEQITSNGSLPSFLLNSISFVFSAFSLVVIAIYMSLDWVNIKARFLALFHKSVAKDVREALHAVENNVGSWVKGQLLLMLVVGVASFALFLVAGISYPLALGFIAGILEIVPMLGPFFSAVIAVAVGFSQSPGKAAVALIISIIVQQLENNFLVPKIMGEVSGFSPLVILLALLIGGEFFGPVGAVLAVPTTMILGILFRRFVHYPMLKD